MTLKQAVASSDSARFKVLSAEPLPSLSEKLRPKANQVWNGADAAYSLQLRTHEALWFFGDTFLSRSGQALRMINNSAARQKLDKSEQPLEFIWGREDSSLFPGNKFWLWPLDGEQIDGQIYEFMNVVAAERSRDPNFAFHVRHQVLMHLNNPEEQARNWKFSTMLCKVPGVQLGNATCIDDRFIYVYSSSLKDGHGNAKHPIILARISLEDLEHAGFQEGSITRKIEYYCGKQSAANAEKKIWNKSHTHATILFSDGAPEMSVTKIPSQTGLFAFYFPPGFGNTIVMRHADHPEGPWSEPQAVYQCPEDTKKYLLYSAKAHPEQSQNPGEITLTYCVNAIATGKESLPANPASYYYPHAVRVVIGESVP